MLYLITGKPGSGKTLHMMSMLLKRKDLRDRPLYIDGIPDVDPEKNTSRSIAGRMHWGELGRMASYKCNPGN
jgi:zonula occludens toxin family protein